MSHNPTAKEIKVIKRADVPGKQREDYINRHEVSLLGLLIEKHPERAREFLQRLSRSMKAIA